MCLPDKGLAAASKALIWLESTSIVVIESFVIFVCFISNMILPSHMPNWTFDVYFLSFVFVIVSILYAFI